MNTTAPLVDTHAHLADHRLAGRLDAVLAACRAEEIVRIVAVGTTAADSQEVVELARHRPDMLAATAGIHPNEAAEATAEDWAKVCALADEPLVVALGETGLDRHWHRTPFTLQQEFFSRHLDLALAVGLPVIIHALECHPDLIAQLRRLDRPVRGVIHSFVGDWDEAKAYLDLGLHISFAGMLTFASRTLDTLRHAASLVPPDRLLVETDSPYLSPAPHRGQTNEPARVRHIAAKLAELRGVALSELATQMTDNAARLFRRVGS